MEPEKEIVEIGNGIEDELVSIKNGSEYCSNCLVLEERFQKLESDLEAKRNDIEQLHRRIVELQSFPKGSDEKSNLMEEVENDKFLELMIENSVLDCEKKKAESDVVFWKAKCEDLESRVRVLENHLSSSTCGTTDVVVVNPVIKTQVVKEDVVTPLIHTFHGKAMQGNERSSRSRKQLNFGEKTPDKMAPATPAAGLINISDDDDDDDDDEGSSLNENGPQQSMNNGQELSSGNTRIVKDASEIEDDIMHCNQDTPSVLCKRKRASRIVDSDTDSDADDNIPLHRLQKKYSNGATLLSHQGQDVPLKNSSEGKSDGGIPTTGDFADKVPLRRLRKRYPDAATVPSRQGQGVPQKTSSESKSNRGIPTTGINADDETGDSESDFEGESLDGFIVSGSESDPSVADQASERDEDEIANSNEKSGSESEEKSEGDVDYVEVMSMIGRKKSHLGEWKLEGDMLAAFGKDDVLCMKAVCALYRQQTSDEKSCKETIHRNEKGFSQFDGTRGSILGEFLSDGDPEGCLNKSVEELKKFQPDGLELCRTLATRYSKQLFAMYVKKEDPLWSGLGDTDS